MRWRGRSKGTRDEGRGTGDGRISSGPRSGQTPAQHLPKPGSRILVSASVRHFTDSEPRFVFGLAVMLYLGPDQLMPLTSVLAAIGGALMIFWRQAAGLGKPFAGLSKLGSSL